jgi:hypothetical protein
MNELSLISELPSTGNQIAQFVRGCKNEILASDTPMESLAQLRAAKKALDDLSSDDDIISRAVDEFDTIGQQKIETDFLIIEKAETGVKYDYTACKDPEWNELYMKEQEIALKRKAREGFLKIARPPEYNPQTGEVTLPRIPAVKTSKTNLKITIK